MSGVTFVQDTSEAAGLARQNTPSACTCQVVECRGAAVGVVLNHGCPRHGAPPRLADGTPVKVWDRVRATEAWVEWNRRCGTGQRTEQWMARCRTGGTVLEVCWHGEIVVGFAEGGGWVTHPGWAERIADAPSSSTSAP